MRNALLLPLLVACNTGTREPEGTPAPPAVNAAAADRFGEAVTLPVTPLSAIASDPAAFKGRPIATTGKVTKVCTHQGCWMAIADEGAKDAIVRMHGHSFFVPPSPKTVGRKARVQGSVVLVKNGKVCEGMDEIGAELELDATGVELGPAS